MGQVKRERLPHSGMGTLQYRENIPLLNQIASMILVRQRIIFIIICFFMNFCTIPLFPTFNWAVQCQRILSKVPLWFGKKREERDGKSASHSQIQKIKKIKKITLDWLNKICKIPPPTKCRVTWPSPNLLEFCYRFSPSKAYRLQYKRSNYL